MGLRLRKRDSFTSSNMLNSDGKTVDLYIPRKCSATNMLITAKDHSSVQINIGNLDDQGRYTGDYATYAFCGFIRQKGESNMYMDGIWSDKQKADSSKKL